MALTEPREMTDSEKQLYREEVGNFFDTEWLEQDGNSLIQFAWKRKDYFAKCEIITLGKCLNTLKNEHEKWIYDNIKTIKSNDLNNSRGAIFEILLAGYYKMMGDEYGHFDIITAKQHQKGYDVSLRFTDEFIDNVSIKWLASSHHNDVFKGKMKSLDNIIKKEIEKLPFFGINICVLLEKYPDNAQEWSKIENRTVRCVKNFDGYNSFYSDELVNIKVNFMSHHKGMKLYSQNKSYSFVASSPFHKNEERNILSKIQNSAYHTSEKSPESNENTRNTCFIRVPSYIDPEYCRRLCAKNKNEMQYKNLHTIFFYCPAIATNLKDNTSLIHHYLSAFITNIPQLMQEKNTHTPGICVPIGITADKYSHLHLITEKGEQLKLDSHYIYQNGKCFIDCLDYSYGEMVHLDSNPDGIEIYHILNVPGGSAGIAAYKGSGELIFI